MQSCNRALTKPRVALQEMLRVSWSRVEIAFPIDDGFKRPLLIGLTSLNLKEALSAVRTRTWKEHKWQIKPSYIEKISREHGFTSSVTIGKAMPFAIATQGRKGKILRFLLSRISVPIEYRVVCVSVG